ncbi:hypothetical protein HYDPIDRAFT_28288 [Hydnomerulius pinastri MD-312]|uniref:DUF6534 domain-containing protein n=1 Tax=Hydnomerulius pinastri MD-312 TaxID=994086 RepID=A0A0C9WAF7_9AGAM|nr:hypothetical protein HYDPIDRAFT_28288 [Hydnomerulius pinastri MD-312]
MSIEIPGFNMNEILGPLILAPIITAFLFGSAVVQTYAYYKKFPDDIWQFKGLVALQMSLETPHVICLITSTWSMVVTHYGEPKMLLTIPRTGMVSFVTASPVTFIAQVFFIFRLHKLSQSRLLPALCFIMTFSRLIIQMIFGIAGFYMLDTITYLYQWRGCITASYVLAIMCDWTIAAALSYHLYDKRKTGCKQTARVIDQLILYSLKTGFITSMVELIEAVCYWTMPDNYIWMAIYAAAPGVYANSLLAALNSRALVSDRMKSSRENPEFCTDVLAKSPGVVTDSDLSNQKRSTRPIVIKVSAQGMNPSSQESLDREALTDIA